MATRKNTIHVPVNFGPSGTIPDATLTTLATPTIYIAENTVTNPVVITSAKLFCFAQDMSTATGGTCNEMRFECTLGGASANTVTELDDLTHSGENWGGIFGPWDFTSYFNTNFGTAGSNTCQVRVYFDISTGTITTVNDVSAYFIITYEYNDAEALRTKTIPICLESGTGALTTTANTTFGTVPQLLGGGGWLNGYASPTVRHIWAEIKGSTGTNAATTAQTITWGFNGAGGGGTGDSRNNSLATDTYTFTQANLGGLTLTSSNTLDLWASVAARYHCISVTIYVTFEYTVAGTTRCLNVARIPVEYNSPLNGTASTARHRFNRTLLIPEPGTITTRSVGLRLTWNSGASTTMQVRAGAQASFRAYATAASVVGGGFVTQHLLDARSASGSALTLARGENTIEIDLYRSTGTAYNVSGLLLVLYESDVSSQGIDNHTRVNYSLARQMDLLLTGDNTISDSFQIPEANYWIQSLGFEVYYWLAAATNGFGFFAEINAGEDSGDGWRQLYQDSYVADNELGFSIWRVRARDEFRRHPLDPDTYRLDAEDTRNFRMTSTTTFRFGYHWLVTYHTLTYTLSGNITNSAGGTVNIEIRKVSDDSLYVRTSRSGNGAYSVNVYDDVSQYYVVAYETNAKKGRSKNDVPATDFDIDLQPTGGGGQKVTWG